MKKYLKWILLSGLCGVLAGSSAAIFLQMLDLVTNIREAFPTLLFGLPTAGLFIGWCYHQFGNDFSKGHNLILEEIHNPRSVLPLIMTPFILISTVVTHLFGASAGREGTVVQMSASLADQVSKLFKVDQFERKILLVAGAGAGFGAAIGAPWAGVIFGMEVIHIGKLKIFALLECIVASFIAYGTVFFLGVNHSHFERPTNIEFDLKTLFFVGFAGIIFGFAARFFTAVTHFVENSFSKLISYPPFKPMVGGCILIVFFWYEGSFRYNGLGISLIQNALQIVSSWQDPILKLLFTALTIGSGFKGGEFVPLVCIGTTLGSFLSVFLPISFQLLAALGFAAVFAGAANTPVACTIMAIEIFGPQIGPYALVACFLSYYFSGQIGIYKSQKKISRKHEPLLNHIRWLGELPQRFFKCPPAKN